MMSKGRLESFSDGVMAIVITLLAFDLKVPMKEVLDASLALKMFISMAPQFLLFFISFVTLSTMWINHHFIVSKIEEVNTKVLWINSLLLMFITLVPFSASFVSNNLQNKISLMIYALLMFLISFMFSKLYKFANHNYKTLFPQTRKLRHVGMVSYALAFFLTPFSILFGYTFICIPLLIYLLPRQ
jgi:uncharacterized membrane protein